MVSSWLRILWIDFKVLSVEKAKPNISNHCNWHVVCLLIFLPPYQAFCMEDKNEAEVARDEGAAHADLLHGDPHLVHEHDFHQ